MINYFETVLNYGKETTNSDKDAVSELASKCGLQTHLQYRFAQNDRDTVVAVAVIAAEPTDEYRQGIEDLDIPSVDYVHEYTLKSAAAA